jgi:hypothetical protein
MVSSKPHERHTISYYQTRLVKNAPKGKVMNRLDHTVHTSKGDISRCRTLCDPALNYPDHLGNLHSVNAYTEHMEARRGCHAFEFWETMARVHHSLRAGGAPTMSDVESRFNHRHSRCRTILSLQTNSRTLSSTCASPMLFRSELEGNQFPLATSPSRNGSPCVDLRRIAFNLDRGKASASLLNGSCFLRAHLL